MNTAVSNRGVSPVIGVILMVAIVTMLASVTGVMVLDIGDKPQDAAPTAGGAEGEFDLGSWGQRIRITLVAGGPLEVENLEIAVDATDVSDGECPTQSRLVDLPINGHVEPSNVDGTDIFDGSATGIDGAIDSTTSADGTWDPGEQIEFRINTGDCDVAPGEQITVRIVHLPTDAVVMANTITA